ncbi:MAG: hypothetical protein FWF92_09615 [Oscillospiraceae bacterium]|nr:hypothetical protein [Oscillospiraceae bacterium]
MRFTKKSEHNGKYFIEEDKIEEATQKLADFENMCEEFIKDMDNLPARLEKLRTEKKEKTVAYKELVAQKLINTNILIFFRRYGIYDYLNN